MVHNVNTLDLNGFCPYVNGMVFLKEKKNKENYHNKLNLSSELKLSSYNFIIAILLIHSVAF